MTGKPYNSVFGLPLPERRIGLSAHDFVQAIHANEVYLTRSTRSGGSPQVPSRWLVRLDTLLGDDRAMNSGDKWVQWSKENNQELNGESRSAYVSTLYSQNKK